MDMPAVIRSQTSRGMPLPHPLAQPDNWLSRNLTFGQRWIDAHISAAQALGKPLVLEVQTHDSLLDGSTAVLWTFLTACGTLLHET